MATVSERHVGGRPPREPGYWGQKVLAHAARKRLTYTEVASAIGVSTSTFGRWMSGHARVPAETVEALADLFGVSMDNLRTTPPPKPKRRQARRTA